MSQVYSKVSVGLGLAGFIIYAFYRKFLNGDSLNHESSNQNTRQLTRETMNMLQQMQRTQNTIFQLQREIDALRQQIRFNKESIESLSSIRKESVTVAVGTENLENDEKPEIFEQTTYVERVNENYARSTQVHFISKSKIDSIPISRKISKTKSESTLISSFLTPTPASDDDGWKTPLGSESDNESSCEDNIESGINDIATHCVQSLESLNSINSLGPEYKFIANDLTTYTPLPSKHLPITTRNFITKLDKLSTTNSPEIDKNIETCWNLLMENEKELNIYLELTWRVCRAAVYLRTLYKMMNNSKRATYFTTNGLKYANMGLKMMETLKPYNLTENSNNSTDNLSENYEFDYISNTESENELYNELKITAIAPMFKWAGSVIGISAEIAPGIQEKINAGFKARDSFKKSIQLDPLDYFAYYNLARWHWEIFTLPSLLKRSANWISSEPFNSTVQDVIPYLDKSLEKYPKDKDLFKTIPADIYLMKAYCLNETGKKEESRKYCELAKESLFKIWKGKENINSILDKASLKEIEKLIQKTL